MLMEWKSLLNISFFIAEVRCRRAALAAAALRLLMKAHRMSQSACEQTHALSALCRGRGALSAGTHYIMLACEEALQLR